MQNSAQHLWLGLGCRRNTPEDQFASAVSWVCAQYGIDTACIMGLATLSTKRAEAGLLAYCQIRQWPLLTFTPQELQQYAYAVPSPSTAVAAVIGVPSVAEAAALMGAAQSSSRDRAPLLVIPKQVLGRVTLALAQSVC